MKHKITKFLGCIAVLCLCKTAYTSTERPKSWDAIKHVVIIVFENTSYSETLKQPYFHRLVKQGALLSQCYAITHPSQPNYSALTSGGTYEVKDDGQYDLNVRHIGNLLNEKKYTWKAYAEAYPGKCFQGMTQGTYYRKHVPFISYTNVQNKTKECSKIVPATEFFKDIAAHKLPTYSLYIPDINHDGHDTGVTYSDKWLEKTFAPLFHDKSILKNTLFMITFDEDDHSEHNRIYTLFLGAGVKMGVSSSKKYDLYSLLKTAEAIFSLDTLGKNDSSAHIINDIWMP